jgi:hypothetical protein
VDVGIEEDYVVQKMREYFPGYLFVGNSGSLGFCNGQYWGGFNYSGLPPEQALDVVRGYIGNYFDESGNIKSANG